jgi:ribonuclease M5
MNKVKIREVIVVEGRYDKNALSQVADALIFETGGFALFRNREKIEALRMLARQRGLILLTDSDGAGFVIRNRLRGMLPEGRILEAFVPAVEGKEKRKRKPSRQGLLGVEGMRPEVLLEALRRAGASERGAERELTAADFYALGLTGCTGASELRARLAESLDLPAGISQSDLRKAVSFLLTKEELKELLSRLTRS